MRDEKEGRNKQARSNKQQGKSHVYVNEKCRRKEEASKLIQTKQSNNLPKAVAFPKKTSCMYIHVHLHIIRKKIFFEVYIHVHVHVLVCCFLLLCCFLTLLLSSFLLHLSLNMYISLCVYIHVHVHVYQLQGIKNVLSPFPPTHPGCCCRQY